MTTTPSTIAYQLAKERQRELIAAAERYRRSRGPREQHGRGQHDPSRAPGAGRPCAPHYPPDPSHEDVAAVDVVGLR